MPKAQIDEASIRDEIAARPELVEVGLTTIAKNYHLPNSEGTRGFIDVLTRDRHGMFAVIEVKRSDSTAREAIHEVIKYCELLRAERGLRSDEVRAIIASSTWRELLVPFSEISRASKYPIDGVELSIDKEFPTSLRTEHVRPLPVPPERDLSALAVRFEVATPGDAALIWPTIVSRLADVGVDDALGIIIGNAFRTLLHVALGSVVYGDPRALNTSEIDEDLHEDLEGYEEEYAAALHVIDHLNGGEIVSPERLTRIIDSNRLDVLDVLRAGRFEDQADLVDDDEAVRLAEGNPGWNQVMATLTGRPSHVLAWRRLRTRLEYALGGNEQWARLIGLWLDEIEETYPSADVLLHVYNPCDLLAALIHSGLGRNLASLVPEVHGALDLPRADGRLIQGILVWDGTPATNARAAIQSVYETPGEWGFARASGTVWETDLQLLEALGLHYAIFEFAPNGAGGPWMLNEEDGVLTRIPATGTMEWPKTLPFPDWLRMANLEGLLQQYRSSMTPVNGGDQWLVTEDLTKQESEDP